jgi:hypothetical protein
MKESREIVHRAVLRAKGLDPDLVPSPSKSPDARGGRAVREKEKRRRSRGVGVAARASDFLAAHGSQRGFRVRQAHAFRVIFRDGFIVRVFSFKRTGRR